MISKVSFSRTLFCGVRHDLNHSCMPVCVQRAKNRFYRIQYFITATTPPSSQLAYVLTPRTYIWGMQDSNPVRTPAVPRFFTISSQVTAGKCRARSIITPRPLPSTSFSIHYSQSSHHSTLYRMAANSIV
jgi:hypothetical protein